MLSTVIVTGASGFLGEVVLKTIAKRWPEVKVLPILSERNKGGIDLASEKAFDWLLANVVIKDPGSVLLIHAAAMVEWNAPSGLLTNVAMALQVARWAQLIGIGFSVLVGGVNVYPAITRASVKTPCDPPSLYGLGKWAAEHVWRLCLPNDQQSVVRLAGLWGWQYKPTLFWNRLMLAAARGFPMEQLPTVRRRKSRRNYISVSDAANCLLEIGGSKKSGLFLAAGREVVDTGTFIQVLSTLHGSRLEVDWQDDGGEDEIFYEASPELIPILTPFSEMLVRLWQEQPVWVRQAV